MGAFRTRHRSEVRGRSTHWNVWVLRRGPSRGTGCCATVGDETRSRRDPYGVHVRAQTRQIRAFSHASRFRAASSAALYTPYSHRPPAATAARPTG